MPAAEEPGASAAEEADAGAHAMARGRTASTRTLSGWAPSL